MSTIVEPSLECEVVDPLASIASEYRPFIAAAMQYKESVGVQHVMRAVLKALEGLVQVNEATQEIVKTSIACMMALEMLKGHHDTLKGTDET